MKEIKFKNLIFFGYMSLFMMFFMLFISSVEFIVNIPINVFTLFISFVCSTLVTKKLMDSDIKNKEFIICTIIFTLALVFFTIFFSFIYGLDWDGNAYHKLAVGLLKNGWNPLYESGAKYSSMFFGDENNGIISGLWIDHYGKASWIIASVFYKITNHVESGRIYQLLGASSCFFILTNYLYQKKYSIVNCIIIGLAVALNTVTLVQISSYYVDGFLFSLFFTLLTGLIMLLDEHTDKVKSIAIILTSMVILSNIKFTGLMYGGVFCFVYFMIYALKNRVKYNKLFNKNTIVTFFEFVFIAILAVTVVGMPTYVKNFIDHGNPVYPLAGEGKVDIMTIQTPKGFIGKSTLYKFIYTMFAEFTNFTGQSEGDFPNLKIPFTLHKKEFFALGVDTHMSGFGFFFSGIFIISIIVILIYIIKQRKKRALLYKVTITNLVLMIIFTILISESWWARYSPYVYLIPVNAILILLSENNYIQTKKVFKIIFIVILLVNNFYLSARQLVVLKNSYEVIRGFNKLKNNKVAISVDRKGYMGNIFDYIDNKIDYTYVKELSDPNGMQYDYFYKIIK